MFNDSILWTIFWNHNSTLKKTLVTNNQPDHMILKLLGSMMRHSHHLMQPPNDAARAIAA
jgi:hypothetical protein